MDPDIENAEHNEINNASIQCFILNITKHNGIWQGDNPFTESLPLLVTQLAAILILTRSLYHLLKPLRQPRIISDILGGILLGPSALGTTIYFADLFPTINVITVETLAYMALVFHMFLVGLEIDLNVIGRISKKAISFTVTGLLFPFTVGIGFFYLLHAYWEHDQSQGYEVNVQGSFLWAAALAVTSFPVVSGILSDLKVLNSDIGRLAMPIALVSDMGSWVLIVIVIPFCANPTNAPYIITTTIAYVLACVYTFRPFLAWIIRRTSKGKDQNYSKFYLCFVLVGVVLSAFVTDVTGTHSIVGAFVFGLILPTELALVLIERFEYFVSGLLMPVFFAVSGVRVDIFKISEWRLVLLIVVWLCAVKIISFLPISLVSDIKPKDSFALGLLMNTKGVWAILIIHTGLDRGVLQDDDYAVMMITILLMTSIVAPIIAAIYKRTNLSTRYERRTIQHANTEAELRILACIHSFCSVPGILKLLDVSQTTQNGHITVFTLHLVELSGCASAMLIVHDSQNRRFEDPVFDPDYGDSSETEKIVNAFREYDNKNRNISIQSLTAVSPFVAMHGDICSLAEDKHATFLILPFHKRATKEGNLPEINAAFRDINKNVLLNAPCSVGIYIDRGLQETAGAKSNNKIHQIAMVFLGGPDDCEALAYAWRMAKNPGVRLTVIRLLEMDTMDFPNGKASMLSSRSYLDRQREIADEYINEFRLRTVGEELIHYEEKILLNGEELAVTLKEIENKFELFIVGRREGLESPLTTLLVTRVDCPELGVIGDLLANSNSATGSVLVVQRFIDSSQGIEDLVATPRSSMHGTVREVGSGRLSTVSGIGLGMYTRQK
ncbi:PREDICTED: cation/H(+) antiporter 15 [Theobroma cacao]|uniref:Cation/H(+) antiporter 15 n=1 Tax=Theobroma cacao TaxID=3641 RepID=A0AB32V111_THECC|nr:PREDICTED: cation/H(+) antiporter 15 [Theobroma cacao]